MNANMYFTGFEEYGREFSFLMQYLYQGHPERPGYFT